MTEGSRLARLEAAAQAFVDEVGDWDSMGNPIKDVSETYDDLRAALAERPSDTRVLDLPEVQGALLDARESSYMDGFTAAKELSADAGAARIAELDVLARDDWFNLRKIVRMHRFDDSTIECEDELIAALSRAVHPTETKEQP